MNGKVVPKTNTTAQEFIVDFTEWFPIPGHSNYEMNREGIVRNKTTKHVNKPYLSGNYYRYALKNDEGVIKQWRACRLGAITFNLPRRPDQIQVDHINGDAHDDRICNLRWRTPSENMSDRLALKGTISNNTQVYLKFDSDTETIYFKSIQQACRYFQRAMGTMWGVYKMAQHKGGSQRWHQWTVSIIDKATYDAIP